MSQPRHIRPGATWLVTRRTTRRHMLFRPDKDGTTQRIYWYVTAVLAEKFGIELHAVQVLSTHLHEVLTDVRGVLPAFLRERNRILANVLKRHRDWPEEVFQRASASCVELYGPNAILQEIGYTLANCVEAGLVSEATEWPGATARVGEIGAGVFRTVERPRMYFNPKNRTWPERASVTLTMPQVLTQTYGERATAVLRSAVRAAVARARRIARKAGYVVRDIARLYRVPFTDRACSREPSGQRNPTFATGGVAELARKAIDERFTFRTLYRQARDALKRGIPGVAFPEGAWRWLRELLPCRTPEEPTRLAQCQSALSVTRLAQCQSALSVSPLGTCGESYGSSPTPR